jgi:uncharacterized protein
MKADRVVCDTNVLISAAIMPSGKARRAINHVIDHARLVISAELFNEYDTRLARQKFDRFVSPADREEFLQLILAASDHVTISRLLRVCRDPDDDKVIETAIAGHADCLLTGDADLLVLRPIGDASMAVLVEDAMFRGVAILKPAEYLMLVGMV